MNGKEPELEWYILVFIQHHPMLNVGGRARAEVQMRGGNKNTMAPSVFTKKGAPQVPGNKANFVKASESLGARSLRLEIYRSQLPDPNARLLQHACLVSLTNGPATHD